MNHPQLGYNVGRRCEELVKGVIKGMAKERAVAARRALPIVPRLGQVALGELVSGILTLQLLDDITNARALVYFGQSSRERAELVKE